MDHSGTKRPTLWAILRYSLSRIWYPLWLAPIFVVAVLLSLRISEVFDASKFTPEVIAPPLLATAVLITARRWYLARHPFLVWLSALVLLFFLRELHFEDTPYEISESFVLGFFMLIMLTAWWQYPALNDYLGSRVVLTLFSTALFCYFISVGLDKHWWKFLPGDKYHDWQWVEEYVEIIGHLMFLLLAVTAKPVSSPAPESD